MNKQVEEFKERVKLTPEEIREAGRKACRKCKEQSLQKYANCFSSGCLETIKAQTEAQLNKVLNDPDLALKVGKVCPKCKGKTTIEVGTLHGGEFHGGDISCPTCEGTGVKGKKVIPLCEVLKEVER